MARGRLLPIFLIAGFFVLAGGLLAIPFVGRDRVPTIDAATPLAFAREIGTVNVRGEVSLADARTLRVGLDVAPTGAAPKGPRLFLEMPEHTMRMLAPSTERAEDGSYASEQILPMTGLWSLLVMLPQGETAIRFLVRD